MLLFKYIKHILNKLSTEGIKVVINDETQVFHIPENYKLHFNENEVYSLSIPTESSSLPNILMEGFKDFLPGLEGNIILHKNEIITLKQKINNVGSIENAMAFISLYGSNSQEKEIGSETTIEFSIEFEEEIFDLIRDGQEVLPEDFKLNFDKTLNGSRWVFKYTPIMLTRSTKNKNIEAWSGQVS